MSLKVCQDCGTAYAPAEQCPHCGGGVFRFSWEEEEMAKATKGGHSNYADGYPADEAPEPVADDKPARKPRMTKERAAELEAERARVEAELAEAGDDSDDSE